MNSNLLEHLHIQLQSRAYFAGTFVTHLWRENPTMLIMPVLLTLPLFYTFFLIF